MCIQVLVPSFFNIHDILTVSLKRKVEEEKFVYFRFLILREDYFLDFAFCIFDNVTYRVFLNLIKFLLIHADCNVWSFYIFLAL